LRLSLDSTRKLVEIEKIRIPEFARGEPRLTLGRITLTHSFRRITAPILAILVALFMGMAGFCLASAQEKKVPQTAGVDNTKMGAYRAIAQHAYVEFQKGDAAPAAQLAHSLERVWDKGEDYGGDTALKKTHPDLFDPARIKAAYNAYLEKLKLAD
jgi:hypothetical protein